MARRKANEHEVGEMTGIRFFAILHFNKRRKKKGSVWLRIESGTYANPKVEYIEMRVGDQIGYDLAMFRHRRPHERYDENGKLVIEDYDTNRLIATLLPGEPK